MQGGYRMFVTLEVEVDMGKYTMLTPDQIEEVVKFGIHTCLLAGGKDDITDNLSYLNFKAAITQISEINLYKLAYDWYVKDCERFKDKPVNFAYYHRVVPLKQVHEMVKGYKLI
jgi:hypothetical protein